MSERQHGSMILHGLKKRELPQRGAPTVPVEEAEAHLGGSAQDSQLSSVTASMLAITPSESKTRLTPRPRRAARSALIVRLDPALHRRLDEVARFNDLSMNDIVIEAIELHLGNFKQPPGYSR